MFRRPLSLLRAGVRLASTLQTAPRQPSLLLPRIIKLSNPWEGSPLFVNKLEQKTIEEPSIITELKLDSVKRKRRQKMKKHKLRKRRKIQRALRIKLKK